MEIQKDSPTTQFICDKVKFLGGHTSFSPVVLWTEIATQVAYVGYLYIAAVYQIYLLFNYLFAKAHQAKASSYFQFASKVTIKISFFLSFIWFIHILLLSLPA